MKKIYVNKNKKVKITKQNKKLSFLNCFKVKIWNLIEY